MNKILKMGDAIVVIILCEEGFQPNPDPADGHDDTDPYGKFRNGSGS